MTAIFLFFSTAFGLMVGSFLNVVIYRLYTKKSIVRDRSRCNQCNKVLKWYELIPVFSFIIQRGKCKNCKARVSWQYPFVEIATGLLFLQIFNFQFSHLRYGVGGQAIFNEFSITQFSNLIFLWIIVSGLVVIFVYDLKHSIIPDIVLVILFIVTLFAYLFNILPINEITYYILRITYYGNVLNALFVGLLTMAPFAFLHFGSRGRWMGFGDVKLAFFMGFLLGPLQVITALFIAFLSGAIIGLALIVSKKKDLKSKIPFGPFLIFGTYIALFWAQDIINWYLSFLL